MKNVKKLLSLITIICLTAMIIAAPGLKPVKANDDTDAKNVIYNYVSAINNKDWDKLIKIEPSLGNSFKSFAEDKTNQKNKTGILDVKSAKLKGILSIPDSEGAKFITNNNTYTDLKYFLVATDYNVYNENKYYVNGTNYDLLSVGKLNGQWKIGNGMMAPLEYLHDDGYGFFDKDENSTIQIIQQLKQGKIVNKSCKILGYDNIYKSSQIKSIDITPSKLLNNMIKSNLQVTSISPYSFNLAFPQTIVVHLYSAGYNLITYTSTYVKDVLPNEWHGLDPYAALEAGAICIKEYAWFHHYHPTSNGKPYGADLIDTADDQVFKKDSHLNPVDATSNQACDAVYRWGLVNGSGNVFETLYCAGLMTGRVSQNGSVTLAKEGYSYMQIIQYYYTTRIYGTVTKQYIGDIPEY